MCARYILLPKGMCTELCDFFKFSKISDNISEIVHDRDIVAVEHNRKSYVAYQMALLPMPLNDLEGHFYCL